MATSPARRDAGRPRGKVVEDAILRAALADLAEHGVDGLSVDRVATAAEVNKTTVYRRFPTTEALVAAALQRAVEDSASELGDHGSFRADLRALLQQNAALMEQPAGRAMVRAGMSAPVAELVAAAGPDPVGREPAAFQAALDRAVERGEVAPSVRVDVVLSVLGGAVIHRAMLQHRPADEGWIDGVLDLVMRGIGAPS